MRGRVVQTRGLFDNFIERVAGLALALAALAAALLVVALPVVDFDLIALGVGGLGDALLALVGFGDERLLSREPAQRPAPVRRAAARAGLGSIR